MSLAITKDGSDAIYRSSALPADYHFNEDSCRKTFRVEETALWITSHGFKQIGLQFPDELLHISSVICQCLSSLTHQFCFILGDSSFAGCCVDEVAGKRFQIDALIHYGRACLSKLTGTLPVLFVFGNVPLPHSVNSGIIDTLAAQIHSTLVIEREHSVQFPTPPPLLITYDFRYRELAVDLYRTLIKLSKTKVYASPWTLLWSEPDFTRPAYGLPIDSSLSAPPPLSDPLFRRCGRTFHSSANGSEPLPPGPWSLVHVGSGSFSPGESAFPLYRILLSMPEVSVSKAFWLDPSADGKMEPVECAMQRLLRRRSYLIEKAKDARRIGILMGTLSVRDYQVVVERIQRLLRRSGRFFVTLVVGRLNEAKLANLPELDLLVLVACAESSLLDSRDLLVPIVTPFELECALASDRPSTEQQHEHRSWTGEKLWIDFRDLLPGGAAYCPEPEVVVAQSKDSVGDISLITGNLRLAPTMDVAFVDENGGAQLAVRSDWSLAERDLSSAHSARTWFGLDPSLGQHPVARLKQGRSGLPTGYDSEMGQESNPPGAENDDVQ